MKKILGFVVIVVLAWVALNTAMEWGDPRFDRGLR